MVVTCPNCSAGYDVPDRLLGPGGRKLRCARCAKAFTAGATAQPYVADPPPPVISHMPEPIAATSPLRAPTLEEKPPASRRSAGFRFRAAMQAALALLAWTGSLALAGGIGWGAIAERAWVMRAWPPSIRLYQELNLDLDARMAAEPTNAASAESRTAPPAAPTKSTPESHPS